MKGCFFSLAIVLAAGSFVDSAGAQQSADSRPAESAVEARIETAVSPGSSATPAATAQRSGAPVAVTTGVGVSVSTHAPATPFSIQEEPSGLKGTFFGTRRRASNTLMIGGVALAGVGVGVVKGDIGALLGMAGLLSAIGGLYLAF